jgi:hypothetical protein
LARVVRTVSFDRSETALYELAARLRRACRAVDRKDTACLKIIARESRSRPYRELMEAVIKAVERGGPQVEYAHLALRQAIEKVFVISWTHTTAFERFIKDVALYESKQEGGNEPR